MRKLVKYLVGFVLLLTAGWLIAHTLYTYRAKKVATEKIQTLQHGCFESLHGGQICLDGFNPNLPTVILYFHPECEHCQYEATEIERQSDRFSNANLILITPDDSIKRVEAFAGKYKLWQVDNLVILFDRKGQFKNQFGTSVVPSVFIYGSNKQLLKQFVGEVKMEAVLKIDGKVN
jgi:peroxiredoxin